ncbi:acyltransferase family protein [Gloeobacter morelensis]|uniref:Acyltransferase n=1 Tax=Gloeobacter morelensis MG652769 TaxID=2781736 RepID=A0ABY3PSK5_9CYAN|nr:acyltransferase [Gloeobacter morelensis]UFP96636.1 acyltransferase [Gloeobacter morelensis MG652769]
MEAHKQDFASTIPTPLLGRIGYLDGVRGFLSLLVIVHHVAVTYGGAGIWYYIEHSGPVWVKLLLTTFVTLNRFYFMGLFFLLAAVFTPGSLARKGEVDFVQERCRRLGIPLVLFALLLSPPLGYLARVYQDNFKGSFGEYLTLEPPLLKDFNPGPLWFVEALLVFSLLYLLVRRLQPRSTSVLKEVTTWQVAGFAVLLAVLYFFVRLVYPLGTFAWHLQLAYFPQYILLFAVGVWAGSAEFFARLNRRWFWPCAALTAWGAAMVPSLVLLNGGIDDHFLGGWHWQAAALCLVEGVTCPAACIAVLLLFRDRISVGRRLQAFLGENSYAVYIVHAPVCVLAALAFRDIPLHPLGKFFVVSLLGVGLSLAVAASLRRWGGKAVRAVLG